MTYTLTQLAADIRETLRADASPAGREKVCGYVSKVLTDKAFIATHLKDRANGAHPREVLYEDPELGFCILAHQYKGAKNSPPHDHGPSWAIYGQAKGETEMTDYALVAAASADKPGKAKPLRTYKLTPGTAYLYNEGDLHSPRRTGPTQLIRLEGTNMDRIKRLRFEAV
jgi:predicted metal-dependent enzyme (double-stranded beta helix superfamily)